MRKKGFTLIELLVVISIVALLSSVVLASLNSARDKGRLAAGKYFSTQVDHVASDYAVGLWDFDECSGTSAADRSGNGNNGTLTAGATFSGDTPSGKGCSASMTGANQYVALGTDASIAGLTSQVTVMGWIKLTTISCYNWIFSNDIDVSSGYNGFALGTYCGGQSVFRIWNSTRTSLGGPSLGANQWYHLAGVHDGSTMKMYIDGKVASSIAYSSGIGTPASFPNTIGNLANCTTCTPHGLLVDSVHIFNKALVASDIRDIYLAEGGSTKQFAKQ